MIADGAMGRVSDYAAHSLTSYSLLTCRAGVRRPVDGGGSTTSTATTSTTPTTTFTTSTTSTTSTISLTSSSLIP